jgi:AcrR family transcriptional regulator
MASSLSSSRRERSAQTRDRVLEVATELMARGGYSGTSISAISKASGVMPASIYWHFESKEGLLAAVIEHASEAWFDGAAKTMGEDDVAQPEAPPHRPGLRYIFEQRPDFYRVLLLIGLERRAAGGPPLAAVKRVRQRLHERLTQRIERRLEVGDAPRRRALAERMAAFAMVLLDGTFLAQQLDPAEGEHLAARYEQLHSVMALFQAALLAEVDGLAGQAK